MGYQNLYICNFTDYFNRPVKVEIKNKVNIVLPVTATVMVMDADPIFISNENKSDDILENVVKSNIAKINIIAITNGQYDELLNSSLTEYQVIISIDYGTGFTSIFEGFIDSSLSNRSYTRNRYTISLTVLDYLSYLKNVDYAGYNGSIYTNTSSQILILKRCFDKLEITYTIKECIELFEDSMTTGNLYSPLNQTTVYEENFYSTDFEPDDCQIVIEKILKTYGAIIKQIGSVFYIERLQDTLIEDDFVYRIRNSSITISSYETVSNRFKSFTSTLGDPLNCFIKQSAMLDKIRKYSNIEVKTKMVEFNYDILKTALFNENIQYVGKLTDHIYTEKIARDKRANTRFTKTSNNKQDWMFLAKTTQETIDFTYVQSSDYIVINLGYFYAGSSITRVYSQTEINHIAGDRNRLSTYGPLSQKIFEINIGAICSNYIPASNPRLDIFLKADTSIGIRYYRGQIAEWVTTKSQLYIKTGNLSSTSSKDLTNFKIPAPTGASLFKLELIISPLKIKASGVPIINTNTISPIIFNGSGIEINESFIDEIVTTKTISTNDNSKKTIEVYFSDCDKQTTKDNILRYYKNFLLSPDGVYVKGQYTWGGKYIHEILADTYVAFYSKSRYKITGEIITENTIFDLFRSDKRLFGTSAFEYNVKRSTFDVTLTEFSLRENYLIEEDDSGGDYILMEDGTKILIE